MTERSLRPVIVVLHAWVIGTWPEGAPPPRSAGTRHGVCQELCLRRTAECAVFTEAMRLEGEYAPSAEQGVRNQVEQIESSGGTAGTTTKGMPVVVMTMRGAKSGKLRKVPVMRVEHDGVYAAVASLGGALRNPAWYHNLVANPRVELQDGAVRRELNAREVHDAEKELWWERCVAAFPEYADLQAHSERQIPVFVLE